MRAARATAAAAVVAVAAGCAALPPQAVLAPPAGAGRIAVFDIDGTLTPQIVPLLLPRDGAALAVQAFAARGYTIVYLSLSAPGFDLQLPTWLARHGFPAGALHVPQTSEERDDPAGYKARVLGTYRALGWQLAYAFGDTQTDFAAYRDAGLARERVYALQRAGRGSCETGAWQRCLGGWPEFLATVDIEQAAPE